MNLSYSYKICWFENEDGWYESTVEKLKEKYEDSKIVFEITRHNNADGVKTIVAETEIDIILMDYNLNGVKGDDIISSLRGVNVLCDIIFYSQNANFDDNLKDREGVHTTGRQNLASELNKKIDKHKIIIENVSTMRGTFITSAIDLEVKMNNIICKYFNIENDKETFLRENFLEKEFFSFQKKYQTINRIAKSLLEKHKANYTANKVDDLKKIMIKAEQTVSVIKEFEKQIIDVRNTLAHSKDKIGEKGETIFTHITSGKEEIIDEKWIRLRMNNLVMHSINLDRLQTLL